MKSVLIFGIIITIVVAAVGIFASLPTDTWQDKRVDIIGVASPDENKEKIDCMSRGGYWDGGCSEPDNKADEESHNTIECSGDAKCITETVTKIVDGDTIYTTNYKIRLSLTNTPEKNEPRFQEAKSFTSMHCPVGSVITVDQDDLQPYDVYDRMLGKVYCEGEVINEMLLSNGLGNILTRYCDTSEFSGEDWAVKYGCAAIKAESPKSEISNCDPSYPDVCIAPYPPDLNCGDIGYSNFRVIGSDPHGFDRDRDGVGCES